MLKPASLGIAAAALMVSAPAYAAPEGNITYKMKRGDTLIALANKHFLTGGSVDGVIRLNQISNPRRIPVGREIKIPRRYLRYAPVNLEVYSVAGPVGLMRKGEGRKAAAKGLKLKEGDVIQTGRKGFVTIVGYRGSKISLPSNSKARFIDARRYEINDLIDVQVKILEGRGNVIAPKLQDQERYRVGNPVAVTAVRGTQFRVGYDKEADLSLSEVTEGAVAVIGDERTVSAPAGFGVTASSSGVKDVEELLPAPTMIEPGKIQKEADLEFALVPSDGAVGYRTQIFRDQSLLEIKDEVVSRDLKVVFGSLEDGRYVVQSRAIAESGLEGQVSTHSFLRKRLGISGGMSKSEYEDAYKFSWHTDGSGESFAAFQMWKSSDKDNLLIDEIGLSTKDVYVNNLSSGDYQWRVATFQMIEGEPVKVWGPINMFSVTD